MGSSNPAFGITYPRRSRCGAVGSLPGRRFDGHRPGERGVEFLDRPAARFDADEEKTDNGEQIPGGKVVESGYERVKRRLRSDTGQRSPANCSSTGFTPP